MKEGQYLTDARMKQAAREGKRKRHQKEMNKPYPLLKNDSLKTNKQEMPTKNRTGASLPFVPLSFAFSSLLSPKPSAHHARGKHARLFVPRVPLGNRCRRQNSMECCWQEVLTQ